MRRVVITGLGVVAPNGTGKDEVWKNSLEGRNCVAHITKFDTEKFSVHMAGEIRHFSERAFIPPRQAHKLDIFTKYAIAASDLALKDSEIDLDNVDRNRIGAYVGNCFGGWAYIDAELRLLHTKGVNEFSPFVGTTYFPAAPQGEITIKYKLKGHSKTIDSGRAGGLTAIGYGARAIAQGRAELILAGATEALLTPYTFAALCAEGVEEPAHRISENGTYQPFDKSRNGWVPGEGAAVLLLEEYEHALRRNAQIYGEIKGFSDINGACHPHFLAAGELGLDDAISAALEDAELNEYNIDLIMADGLGTSQGDLAEYQAIKKSLNGVYSKIPVTVPKTMTGNLYGAAGALDAFWASMCIAEHTVLPTINGTELDPLFDLNIVDKAIKNLAINNVLINGRGNGGICASLIIGSVDQ